ncbi:MAG: hypothetical protein SFT94_02950, partial [Pseudanabaenaceae cyanobacterium bins.68]|nr:hypothetical protein [Pseudanabaenaceae cyanobacterium bins.68]
GGFDPHFAPAYYEDTDLCFQLRARGYQVLYQPRAVVIHYEGISHGVQLNLGLKQAQTQNQFKFWQKWRHQLQFHHPASSGLRTSKITICLVASGSSPQLSAIAQLLLRLGYHLSCWIEQLDFNLGQTLQQQGVELLYPTHLASGFAAQIRQVHQIYCLDQAIATKYRAIFLTLGNQVKIISGASRKNQAGLAASEIPDRITTNPLAKFLTFFDE